MTTIFTKPEPLPVGSSASGFGPHVEELHAFFKTREVGFGSPEELKPFVERLDSDAAFRDEIASMMRTIIYRERDGLSWPELVELLTAAVGGEHVEDAESPEVREGVRRLMAFVEGVFRTRRNPGATSGAGAEQVAVAEPEPEAHEQKEEPVAIAPVAEVAPVAEEAVAAEVAVAEHPRMDVFYRARMAAHDEVAEKFVEERRIADTIVEERGAENGATATETVLLHRETTWHVPLEDFEYKETAERGSPAWLWVAGICALLLAFCAGLFVHQHLMMPLRDANMPYEAPPQQAAQGSSVPATGATNWAQPPAVSAAASGAAGSAATAAPVTNVKKPGAVPGASDASVRPKYMAPAMMGASPTVMEARLVYAPPPAYPMMAEMTHIQGKVTVEAVVGKDGRVIRARAISGHHLLRGAALREVYARRYRPYTVDNRPRDVATMVTVDFRLRP